MSYQKLLQRTIGVTLAMLLLIGCDTTPTTLVSEAPAATSTPVPSVATPTPTPLPPTATPTPVPPARTPEPPTATPTQAFILATSAEEIVGTWQKTIGAGYIRFYEDGAFHQARALDNLDSKPFAICEFRFEGTQMLIKEISVSGVPSCGEPIGIYEVRLLEGGKIQIVSIKDKCSPRRGDTATVYEPVR
jgi:hypothetical protein